MKAKSTNGEEAFSLLEVLIAMAILSLVMGAYFTQFSQQVLQTQQLQDRTLAHLALQQYLQEILIHQQLSSGRGQLGTGNQNWQYSAHKQDAGQENAIPLTLNAYDQSGILVTSIEGLLPNNADINNVGPE